MYGMLSSMCLDRHNFVLVFFYDVLMSIFVLWFASFFTKVFFIVEIRQEQVQKALAEMKEKSAVPLNSKRHSILFPTTNGHPVTVNANGDKDASLVRKISDSGSSEEDEDSMKSGHDSSSNVSSMRTSSLKSQDGQSSFHSDTSNSTGVAIYQNQISYSSIERASASTALSTTVVDGLTELINNLGNFCANQ